MQNTVLIKVKETGLFHSFSDVWTQVFFCVLQDSDEEDEDPELRKAIKKMKKLDQILTLKVSAEREVKRKGRELHLRLWQELQVGYY